MTRTVLKIAGKPIKYKSLTYSDYVSEIGEWSAKIGRILKLSGFSTVEIIKDGVTEFKGRLQQPTKQYGSSGPSMTLSGPEWSARLIDSKTPHAVISESPIGDALDTILQDCPFPKGTVDDFGGSLDPHVWNTSFEFLKFAYTKMCIVFSAAKEVTSELSTDNVDKSHPPLRCTFWYDGTTKRFYVVAYDLTATQMKYNFSEDGETWNGWNTFAGASPAATEGANGNFAVAWHDSKVYLLVDDGANIDLWRGTINDGTGVITLSKIKDNLDAGDLIIGPFFDGDDHVWCCVDDGVNYVFWESTDDGVNWNNRFNATDVPKYAFNDIVAADITVIEYDSGNKDIEEWIWDHSGSSYSFYKKIGDINENTMGFCSGFQDAYLNAFIVWEDVHAGGDSDLYFSHRFLTHLFSDWSTPEKVVDDSVYSSDNFCMSGDKAGNLYLFWKKKAAGLQLSRYFEGSWDSAVQLDSDCYAGDGIGSPETGLAVFCFYKDGNQDAHFILLSPYALGVEKSNRDPDFLENHEAAHDYDALHDRDYSTITTEDTANPFSGLRNIKMEVEAGQSYKGDYFGVDCVTRHGSSDERYMQARKVQLVNDADDNDHAFFFRWGSNLAGASHTYAGLRRVSGAWKWTVWYYPAGGPWTYATYGSAATLGQNYTVEYAAYIHASNGWVKLWVNGNLEVSVTGINTSGWTLDWATVGGTRFDTPAGNGQILYLDDFQISTEYIGVEIEGSVKTDQYDASLNFQKWGQLASPGITRSQDALWSVLKPNDDVLASGLKVPVDLDDAGVPDTETSIKIKAETIYFADAKNYIYEIDLSEIAGRVDLVTDYENCYIGLEKPAKILGAEYKLNYDDEVDFVVALGEDKSDRIVFKTARSASYDYSTEINIKIVERTPDHQYFANCVKVLGAGEYPDRVEAEAKDYDSISELAALLGGSHNGEIWVTVTNQDLITTGMAQTQAENEVAVRSAPRERISCEVLDEYDPGQIRRGDTVMLVAEEINIEQAVRIVGMRKTAGILVEKISLDVVNRLLLSEFVRTLTNIDDLTRWVRA